MNKYFWLCVLPLMFMSAFAGCRRGPGQPDPVAARTVAEDWLKLLDTGAYEESWDAASSHFQNIVTREDWRDALVGRRQPLGDVSARTLKSQDFHPVMSGLPAGEYFLIKYDSSFARKKNGAETVVSGRGEDGIWRVFAYYPP